MDKDLETIKKQLQEVNNKQIRLQTLIDQAKQKCQEIEQKYNISNETELKTLLEEAEKEYQDKVTEAVNYLADAENALLPYEALL